MAGETKVQERVALPAHYARALDELAFEHGLQMQGIVRAARIEKGLEGQWLLDPATKELVRQG